MTFLAGLRTEIAPLIGLAIPVVAGLIGATALGAVDTVMLGPLGATPLAAVSLTMSVLIIFYAGLYGLMGPTGLLIGQAFGAGDWTRIASVLRHALVIAFVGGSAGMAIMAGVLLLLPHFGQPPEVLAILTPYWLAMSALLIPFCLSLVIKQMLESTGRPWTAAALMIVPVLVNIPLNWALIYGQAGLPALGLAGAGIASLAAYWAGTAGMFAYVALAPALASLRRRLALDTTALNAHVREGLPMATQYLLEGTSAALAGIMIGWLGAIALAANQIAFSIGGLVYMMPLGISAAVSIRVAQAIGEGDRARLRSIGFAGLAIVTAWMLLFTVLLIVLREDVARLFVDDRAVIAVAATMFFTFGLMQIFDGVQSVSLGALRGLLDNDWPVAVSLVAYWLIALPVGYLLGLVFGLGPAGVWAGFGVGLGLASVALTWRFLAKTA